MATKNPKTEAVQGTPNKPNYLLNIAVQNEVVNAVGTRYRNNFCTRMKNDGWVPVEGPAAQSSKLYYRRFDTTEEEAVQQTEGQINSIVEQVRNLFEPRLAHDQCRLRWILSRILRHSPEVSEIADLFAEN